MAQNARIIDELVARVEALEAQLRLTRQVQADQLQQGEDRFSVRGTFRWTDIESLDLSSGEHAHHATVNPTWNEIFCAVAPDLRAEVSTAALTRGLRDFFRKLAETKRLSSNGCGWVEARSAGRRGVLAARVASELTAHGVHLTGGGRGAPWPGVGRSGVAAGRTACQRATRVLRCATALRVTHRPSLRSSSRYGPCGPAWTGASRPSTTTRKSATAGGFGIDAS